MNCLKCWIEFTRKEWYLHCKDCYEFFITSQPRDYTLLVNIDTPKEIRRKFDIGDIYINQIQCNKCWDVIRSKIDTILYNVNVKLVLLIDEVGIEEWYEMLVITMI